MSRHDAAKLQRSRGDSFRARSSLSLRFALHLARQMTSVTSPGELSIVMIGVGRRSPGRMPNQQQRRDATTPPGGLSSQPPTADAAAPAKRTNATNIVRNVPHIVPTAMTKIHPIASTAVSFANTGTSWAFIPATRTAFRPR